MRREVMRRHSRRNTFIHTYSIRSKDSTPHAVVLFPPLPHETPEEETLGNLVQKFRSRLVDKSYGLLTGYRKRRYRLLRSRDGLLSVLYFLLTLWKFLIGRGCVLFVCLGGWAGRMQGFLYLSSIENIDYRKLGGDLDWIQYHPIAFKFGWLALQPKTFIPL